MTRLSHSRQRGLALVCALMLLLGAMLLGLSVARAAFGNVAAARYERERMLARAAAEAALLDAEADLAGGAQPASARAGWFAAGSGGFADGCGRGGQDLGLCLPAASTAPAAWQAADLATADSAVRVPYGRYTGAAFGLGGGALPARLPGYLIERLPPAGAGPPAGTVYRITAIGFGTRDTAQVVLQALYRKPSSSPAPGAEGAGSGGAAAGGAGGGASGAGVAGAGAGGADADGADPGGAATGGARIGGAGTGGAVTDGAGTGGTGPGGAATGGAGPSGTGVPQGEAPGPAPAAGAPIEAPAGRIAWREIANWQALHAQAIQ